MEFITKPEDIEKKSFEIIGRLIADREIYAPHRGVITRVIHTTADLDYADNLVFAEGAIENALKNLRNGAAIVTDTQMAKAGINKRAASALGCTVSCFIDSEEVAVAAKEGGVTRAATAIGHAARTLDGPLIFAVGNAPTALIKLYELVAEGALAPALIIAVPVGFVNVVESKELITRLDIPYIVAKGRKGGSGVAAAIVNALLYEAVKKSP